MKFNENQTNGTKCNGAMEQKSINYLLVKGKH
jgi:hypothetical protein